MKKALLTALLVVGVSAATFAQGTVSFQNFTSATGKVYTNSTPQQSGAVVAPSGFTVALLAGAVGTPIGSLTVVATFTSATGGGQFFDGAVINTGTPAGTGTSDTTMNVTLAIQGWTGNFANYAAAVAGGALVGETSAFNNPTGGAGTPPATPANLIGWTSANNLILAPVPEPTTIALGGLGAAALLLFRRRK